MREWVVLVETNPLDGLTYSIVEHVTSRNTRLTIVITGLEPRASSY
jgi:hypothetical protein